MFPRKVQDTGKRKQYLVQCSGKLADPNMSLRHHQPPGLTKPQNEALQCLRETAGLGPPFCSISFQG